MQVIDSGQSRRPDSVSRLRQFQGDYPDVRFASPSAGRCGQFTALIPPGTIPGENREIKAGSADLWGLMDQLDDLLGRPPDAG